MNTDYSQYSTRPKARWGRILALWAVLIALMTMMFSCQMAEASEELPIAVQTIIGECANCTDEGMIAVGNVIRNRAVRRGQTVEEVCLAKWQFSFWNDRERARKFIKNASSLTVNRAWSAWQASASEDVSFGADHYFADYIKEPSWVSRMAFIRTIGRHQFYRAY